MTRALLLAAFMLGASFCHAGKVEEVAVLKLDGDFTFVRVDPFRHCLVQLSRDIESGVACMNKLGIDNETLMYLAETNFRQRISYYDQSGSRVPNPPPGLYNIDEPASQPKPQPRPSNKGDGFTVERVYESSILSIGIVIKTDTVRRIKCAVEDASGSTLSVKSWTVEPPVDEVIMLTGEDTSRVKRATCW